MPSQEVLGSTVYVRSEDIRVKYIRIITLPLDLCIASRTPKVYCRSSTKTGFLMEYLFYQEGNVCNKPRAQKRIPYFFRSTGMIHQLHRNGDRVTGDIKRH